MRKFQRSDQWPRIENLLSGKITDPGRTAADNRLFVESGPWIARTGLHGGIYRRSLVPGTDSANDLATDGHTATIAALNYPQECAICNFLIPVLRPIWIAQL